MLFDPADVIACRECGGAVVVVEVLARGLDAGRYLLLDAIPTSLAEYGTRFVIVPNTRSGVGVPIAVEAAEGYPCHWARCDRLAPAERRMARSGKPTRSRGVRAVHYPRTAFRPREG